jgi:hypothetical protein
MKNLIRAALMWAAIGLPCAVLADDETHRIDLGPDDIDTIKLADDIARFKLSSDARQALYQITLANDGDWLEMSVEGIHAATARINTPVDNGHVQIHLPSEELRAKLQQYQQDRLQQQNEVNQ